MLFTSVRLALQAGAHCADFMKVYEVLRAEGAGLDTPVPVTKVLDLTGLDAATWTLRCVSPGLAIERDRIARLFAADCAEAVLHLFERECPGDKRPRAAIAVVRRSATCEATPGNRASALVEAQAASDSVLWVDSACASALAAAWAAEESAPRAAWSAAMAAVAASKVAGAPVEAELTRLFRDYLHAAATMRASTWKSKLTDRPR